MKMGDMAGMDMGAAAASAARRNKSRLVTMNMVAEPRSDFAATLLWGRTRSLANNGPASGKENSYLAEALLRFASKNYVWTRLENAGRSNELLLTPGSALPAGFSEEPIGHVAAYTLGYDHDLALGAHLLAAPGAQFTVYRTPQALRSIYSDAPTGEVVFVRFRLR
jgi:hypothetical protein